MSSPKRHPKKGDEITGEYEGEKGKKERDLTSPSPRVRISTSLLSLPIILILIFIQLTPKTFVRSQRCAQYKVPT